MGIIGALLYNLRNIKRANKFRAMSKEELLALSDDKFYEMLLCVCEDAVYDINDSHIEEKQKLICSLLYLEAEVNNGGLCQFFVNSSSECAPYISEALEAVGAFDIKNLFDSFISENKIDVNDLSSFKISSIVEYEAQTKRYDFDSFDDKFYREENLHQRIIDYSRKNIEWLMKK